MGSYHSKHYLYQLVLHKTSFIVCTPLFLVSHALGLRPFKIISRISNKAKWLGGVNRGHSQDKSPRLTRNKNICFVSHLTRAEPQPIAAS